MSAEVVLDTVQDNTDTPMPPEVQGKPFDFSDDDVNLPAKVRMSFFYTVTVLSAGLHTTAADKCLSIELCFNSSAFVITVSAIYIYSYFIRI